MPKSGPIIYLEDDTDDQELLQEVFVNLGVPNKLKLFDDCELTLEYLRTTMDQPFLIIADINLPKMNGIELRAEICKDEYLRQKSIPFIFLTTSDNKATIDKAYEMQVQGYFQKTNSYSDMQQMIKMVVDYWKICKHPNSY